mmetsp:Transcript_30043/g.96951  ORF Transcript_30043/g.96951 Transcript_30043/m.96951 type:complete len:327 (+) Transcript_30043:663-1643(+)
MEVGFVVRQENAVDPHGVVLADLVFFARRRSLVGVVAPPGPSSEALDEVAGVGAAQKRVDDDLDLVVGLGLAQGGGDPMLDFHDDAAFAPSLGVGVGVVHVVRDAVDFPDDAEHVRLRQGRRRRRQGRRRQGLRRGLLKARRSAPDVELLIAVVDLVSGLLLVLVEGAVLEAGAELGAGRREDVGLDVRGLLGRELLPRDGALQRGLGLPSYRVDFRDGRRRRVRRVLHGLAHFLDRRLRGEPEHAVRRLRLGLDDGAQQRRIPGEGRGATTTLVDQLRPHLVHLRVGVHPAARRHARRPHAHRLPVDADTTLGASAFVVHRVFCL